MPTVVTSTIGTGGDYTSLQAWEDAMTLDLVAADEQQVGECFDQAFSSGSTLLTVAGHTTDATRNIILTTNGTASFKDKAGVRTTALLYNTANGTSITCTGGYQHGILIDDENCVLRGLQIAHTGAGGGEQVIRLTSGSGSARIDKCIVKSTRTMISSLASLIVSNSLVEFPGGGTGVRNEGTSTIQVRNCALVNTSGSAAGTGLNASSGTIECVNTALFNLATYTTGAGAFTGSDYNATDNATFPVGSNNLTSLTFANQFESTTTDFRAKSTGDLQAGTPDATYAPDDISDLTRDATTPWIGAWEVEAVGGTILPLNNHYMLSG